jgi:hypothetical protein
VFLAFLATVARSFVATLAICTAFEIPLVEE